MPSTGNNPIVDLIAQSREGEVTTTVVRLRGSAPADPVAPAGLWKAEESTDQAVQDLHKLVGRDEVEGSLTFETYEEQVPLLEEGSVFRLQSWWTPEAFAAVTDTTLAWQLVAFDKGDHEHCLLTWKTINSGDQAYWSQAGWISTEAYTRFIAEDRLRLRS
jgi:hypothetical protein